MGHRLNQERRNNGMQRPALRAARCMPSLRPCAGRTLGTDPASAIGFPFRPPERTPQRPRGPQTTAALSCPWNSLTPSGYSQDGLAMRWLPLLLLILLGSRAFGQVPADRTDAQGDALPADALLRIGSARLRHGAPIMSLAFAANGTALASCGRDHTVRLWEAATGRPLRTLKDRGNIVALSPDGRTLAAVGLNGLLQFWDTATGRPKAEAIELPRTLCLAFSPDGKILAT